MVITPKATLDGAKPSEAALRKRSVNMHSKQSDAKRLHWEECICPATELGNATGDLMLKPTDVLVTFGECVASSTHHTAGTSKRVSGFKPTKKSKARRKRSVNVNLAGYEANHLQWAGFICPAH